MIAQHASIYHTAPDPTIGRQAGCRISIKRRDEQGSAAGFVYTYLIAHTPTRAAESAFTFGRSRRAGIFGLTDEPVGNGCSPCHVLYEQSSRWTIFMGEEGPASGREDEPGFSGLSI